MGILDKLKEKVENFAKRQEPFDPSTLDDEFAMQVKWTPAKVGGTNICTHSLKVISKKRVEFKINFLALFFPCIFMFLGAGAMVGMTIMGLKKDIILIFFGIPFGSIFFFIGFFILRSWKAPLVFDKSLGYYWKGGKNTFRVDLEKTKENCLLTDIYAIQLLQEYCRTNSSQGASSSFFSYELNLVLESGDRLNVIDHGKLSLIQSDAEKLSKFLNVPVWDATF